MLPWKSLRSGASPLRNSTQRIAALALAFGLSAACSGGTGSDAGPNTGPFDAGDDAGPVDAGLSQCGEPLLACPGGIGCPPNSTCADCKCEVGYIPVDCGGTPCPEPGCTAGAFSCIVIPTCGAANFTLDCSAGVRCPTYSTCGKDGVCDCDVGFAPAACDGTACDIVDGGCHEPSWWCAERRDEGSCGILNNYIQCPTADGGFYYCPSNSLCEGATCKCNPNGFSAENCQGTPCSVPDAGCTGDNWWCKA